ncbi:hypothetical protein M885DRAFT_506165 [Pelagophyceae sp. CCMP2097]|nr:hypothetical protein M885DRAFT_506165 [Pelagophyceae sp. CCMP2097]
MSELEQVVAADAADAGAPAPAAAAKCSVLLVAEALPCGPRTLKASLPAGKRCTAATLLGLFASKFDLDASQLGLCLNGGEPLTGGDRVHFDDELTVATVVARPAAAAAPVAEAAVTAAAAPAAADGPPAAAEAPAVATMLAAHACVAVYGGTDAARAATFDVSRYLRYALLDARGEGLQRTFSLDVDAADAQTAELADETTAALSRVVAALEPGDRVELEWVQVSLPSKAGPPRVVRQTQKLSKLSATEEAALAQRHPSPQIMMAKNLPQSLSAYPQSIASCGHSHGHGHCDHDHGLIHGSA